MASHHTDLVSFTLLMSIESPDETIMHVDKVHIIHDSLNIIYSY